MAAIWTTPRTWVAGELVTAALLNTHLRDNFDWTYARRLRYAQYSYTVASGTNNVAITFGSWQTITLNTENVDGDAMGSLASNQITLAAGTYRCEASVYSNSGNPGRLRLRNITAGTTISTVIGTNHGGLNTMEMFGFFTIGSSTVVELQAYIISTNSTASGALTSGESEVYNRISFERLVD